MSKSKIKIHKPRTKICLVLNRAMLIALKNALDKRQDFYIRSEKIEHLGNSEIVQNFQKRYAKTYMFPNEKNNINIKFYEALVIIDCMKHSDLEELIAAEIYEQCEEVMHTHKMIRYNEYSKRMNL